jgi:hypothetical protein
LGFNLISLPARIFHFNSSHFPEYFEWTSTCMWWGATIFLRWLWWFSQSRANSDSTSMHT